MSSPERLNTGITVPEVEHPGLLGSIVLKIHITRIINGHLFSRIKVIISLSSIRKKTFVNPLKVQEKNTLKKI